MKADDVEEAALLVAEARRLENCHATLLRPDAGDKATVKVYGWGLGREMCGFDIPPSYIAKALREYLDAVTMKAESFGVDFKD